MKGGLRELWGLGEPRAAHSTALSEQFRRDFSHSIEGIQVSLQSTAASATPEKHGQANAQREVLYAAYQKTLREIDPANEAKAVPAMKRVLSAAKKLQKKSASFALNTMMASEEWRAREDEFAEYQEKIRELEQANHPKAGILQQITETIRSHANKRNYNDALEALNQLGPKLSAIYQEHQGPNAQLDELTRPDLNDLSDELVVAQDFITLWNSTLENVAGQVESMRDKMKDNQSPRVRCIYDGLATVMQKFPDLDLSKLVDAAKGNDRKAYIETLKQTSREVKEVRDLLAKGPLLSTIDKNPYYKTNVHKTVNETLNVIARVLRVP